MHRRCRVWCPGKLRNKSRCELGHSSSSNSGAKSRAVRSQQNRRFSPRGHKPKDPSRSSSGFRELSAHLFHELAHPRNMTRRALFHPHFIPLRSFLQVREEQRSLKLFPEPRQHRLNPLPNSKKLTVGLKEQIFVQQTVVEHRARLFPIAHHHHYVGPRFRSRSPNAHCFLERFHKVTFEEPVSRLPQSSLAPQFVEFQLKCCLFVRRFRFHIVISLIIYFLILIAHFDVASLNSAPHGFGSVHESSVSHEHFASRFRIRVSL